MLGEPYRQVELAFQQRERLIGIKKNLEEMVRNRKFNPFLLDEIESESRGILEQQVESSLAFMAGWNHFFELIKQAREDASSWQQAVELAIAQLNELLSFH